MVARKTNTTKDGFQQEHEARLQALKKGKAAEAGPHPLVWLGRFLVVLGLYFVPLILTKPIDAWPDIAVIWGLAWAFFGFVSVLIELDGEFLAFVVMMVVPFWVLVGPLFFLFTEWQSRKSSKAKEP